MADLDPAHDRPTAPSIIRHPNAAINSPPKRPDVATVSCFDEGADEVVLAE